MGERAGLEQASADALIARLRHQLAAGIELPDVDRSYAPEGPPIPAAVLVPVVLRPDGPTVLLTQRTSHLRDHAGQVSFPGGRFERSDASFEITALREAEEEVGLHPRHIEIIGRLPQFVTITGFSVTPVVGIVTPPFDLRLDAFEVAEIFEPPLSFLLDQANHVIHHVEHRGRPHHYWAMPWQGYHIWGATAGMLRQLSEIFAASAK